MPSHIIEKNTVLHNMSAPPRSKVNFRILAPEQTNHLASETEHTAASSASGLVCLASVDLDIFLGLELPDTVNYETRLIGIAFLLINHLPLNTHKFERNFFQLKQLPTEQLHDRVVEMADRLPKPDFPSLGMFAGAENPVNQKDTLFLLHLITHANGNTYTRDTKPILPDLASNFRHGLWIPV